MDWITFIIPAIVACMALVLLKLVDEKRRKTKQSSNQKMSIMMYALTFSATFAFVWGIGFLQRNNKTADIESGGDASIVVDIDKMIEMTDHSGKAPF